MDLEAQLIIYGEHERRRRLVFLLAMVITHITFYYKLLFLSKHEKIPYHTSILTGGEWILELLSGHPDRIKTSLGVSHDVFDALVQVMKEDGFKDSRHGISVEEQLGIFLHTAVTGLSTRYVAERFQHSPTTISRYVCSASLSDNNKPDMLYRYFKDLLNFFSSRHFYASNVKLPTTDTPLSTKITLDPRFHFFDDCIGAVDGTHIWAFVAVEEHPNMRNRKGFLSQNCLFVCNFELLFTYAVTGWDGTTADTTMWHEAHSSDLGLPDGKYLLADAGFGGSDALLVPY